MNIPNIHVGGVVPTKACVPVTLTWIQQNLWIIAIIIAVAAGLLGWVVWLACYKNNRPAIVRVRGWRWFEGVKGVVTRAF